MESECWRRAEAKAKRLWRLALGIVRDRDKAEDLYQEMWVRLLEAGLLGCGGCGDGLIVTASRCAAYEYLASKRHHYSYNNKYPVVRGLLAELAELAIDYGFETRVVDDLTLEELLAKRLTPRQRYVIEKRLEGYTQAEIGVFLGLTRSMVSRIQTAALNEIRRGEYNGSQRVQSAV